VLQPPLEFTLIGRKLYSTKLKNSEGICYEDYVHEIYFEEISILSPTPTGNGFFIIRRSAAHSECVRATITYHLS